MHYTIHPGQPQKEGYGPGRRVGGRSEILEFFRSVGEEMAERGFGVKSGISDLMLPQ